MSRHRSKAAGRLLLALALGAVVGCEGTHGVASHTTQGPPPLPSQQSSAPRTSLELDATSAYGEGVGATTRLRLETGAALFEGRTASGSLSLRVILPASR